MMQGKETRIRELVFPSRRAVATHFKTSYASVTKAIAAGRCDEIGVTLCVGREQPVERRGIRYASQSELARALNVSPAAVSFALRDGRIDQLGDGMEAKNIARRSPGQVEITCPDCGLVRFYDPSKARTLKSHRCKQCVRLPK